MLNNRCKILYKNLYINLVYKNYRQYLICSMCVLLTQEAEADFYGQNKWANDVKKYSPNHVNLLSNSIKIDYIPRAVRHLQV